MNDYRSVKNLSIKKQADRSEPAVQFEQIFDDYHNPQNRDKKRMEANRKQRLLKIKQDLGV